MCLSERCSKKFGSPRGDAPMALTGPEKAMYNFLIKREAAGNLNASQKTALDALKAKVASSPQPLKGKVVTAPPPPDAAKQAAAAKAAAAQKAAAAKAAAAKKAELEAAAKAREGIGAEAKHARAHAMKAGAASTSLDFNQIVDTF